VNERPFAHLISCDRAPTEVLGLELAGAVLDARAASTPWSQGDFGLAASRGARGLLLSLEDATAPGHELVHGAGHHARTLALLRAARSAGLEVSVGTTITRSSARSTAALAELLVEVRVIGWHLALAAPRDRDDAAARSPSLGVCVPHVLRAADQAARGGVEVFFDGLPRCVLGPFARWQWAREGASASTEPCRGCPSRAQCPGLPALHHERFGARELRAVPAVADAQSTPRRALAAQLRAGHATPLAPPSKTSAD
jgi:hypothetical protein